MNNNCGCGLDLVFPQGEYAGYPGLGFKMPVVEFGDKTTLVEETTVAFAKDGDNDWYISGNDPLSGFASNSFLANTLYTITWDGTEYECFFVDQAYYYGTTVTHSCFFIGNPSDLGFSPMYPTDAPFVIAYSYPNEYPHVVLYAFDSTASSHTIKVEKTPFEVTLMPGQYYLPTYRGNPLVAAGTGNGSLVQGKAREASGESSHAEGHGTIASEKFAHAEGSSTTARGDSAHSEGMHTTASGAAAHSEGRDTVASGNYSHAEGYATESSGSYAHVEGASAVASGMAAHAEGRGTIANHQAQHALGRWNVADPSSATAGNIGNYIEIVGNGTADNARSNARTLDWEGNERLAGSLTLGSTTITEQQLIALLAML